MKRTGKRAISVLMLAALLLGLVCTAGAANQDLVFTQDGTINASFVIYGNITVKSGAHVVITSNSGFEIAGNITVEPGGSLTCNGVGSGDFNFSMRSQTATISGMDLYYKLNEGGTVVTKKVPGGYAAIAAMENWDFAGGWCPSFKWDSGVQGWCLKGVMNGNPFHEILYHSQRDMDTAGDMANQLRQWNLLQGAGKNADGSVNYALGRPGTRVEALVMLIRFLGKETEALKGTWRHPFTDVPAWADAYVGYAYEKGLTKGTSATTFGTGDANCQMYLTFLMRALGYTDEDVPTTVWDSAMDMAKDRELFSTKNDSYEICTERFWRSDLVVLSYRVLSCRTKDGRTLEEKLRSEGVF